jgi:hypothetical protein
MHHVDVPEVDDFKLQYSSYVIYLGSEMLESGRFSLRESSDRQTLIKTLSISSILDARLESSLLSLFLFFPFSFCRAENVAAMAAQEPTSHLPGVGQTGSLHVDDAAPPDTKKSPAGAPLSPVGKSPTCCW